MKNGYYIISFQGLILRALFGRSTESVLLAIGIGREDAMWPRPRGVLREAADLAALTTAVATADAQRKGPAAQGPLSHQRKYPHRIAESMKTYQTYRSPSPSPHATYVGA